MEPSPLSLLPSPHHWLVASARGPHPFPSRTRPLSLSAPMVLPLRGGGRVGRRQPYRRKPLARFFESGVFCLRNLPRPTITRAVCVPPYRWGCGAGRAL